MKLKIITTFAVSSLLLAVSASAAQDLDKMFAKQDADGSGGVSAVELANARIAWAAKQGKKKGLSDEEIKEKAKKIAAATAKQFKKIDKDGDGELSKEEWLKQRK